MIKIGRQSEAVAAGHPDIVMDIIADSIVDLALSKNKNARTGIEGITCTDEVIVRGEVGGITLTKEEIDSTVRKAVDFIGYQNKFEGFSSDTLNTNIFINQQSSDIAQGVVDTDVTKVKAWGDNGIYFGYSTDETPLNIDVPFFICKELMAIHSFMDKDTRTSFGIKPDAKCVFVESEEGNELVFCVSHYDGVNTTEYVEHVINKFKEVYPEFEFYFDNCNIRVNPTGKFVICGPNGDCGTVGRKLTATSYGGSIPLGGGALCGKDPSKSDRSLQYMCRWIANELLQFDLHKVMVSMSTGIGIAEPTGISVHSNELSPEGCERAAKWVLQNFDLTPEGVFSTLNLKNILYFPTALNGHFGVSKFMPLELSEESFTWER